MIRALQYRTLFSSFSVTRSIARLVLCQTVSEEVSAGTDTTAGGWEERQGTCSGNRYYPRGLGREAGNLQRGPILPQEVGKRGREPTVGTDTTPGGWEERQGTYSGDRYYPRRLEREAGNLQWGPILPDEVGKRGREPVVGTDTTPGG